MTRLQRLIEARSRRWDAVAAQIESGEGVDWNRVRDLESVDMVRAGQAALQDAQDLGDEFDGSFG